MNESGSVGSVTRSAWNSPIQIGNWMSIGPKQPRGFTPASRYSFMVSWEARPRSPAYRSCIWRMRGCRELIARICRVCLSVRGSVAKRTIMVKMIIESQNCSKNT